MAWGGKKFINLAIFKSELLGIFLLKFISLTFCNIQQIPNFISMGGAGEGEEVGVGRRA